MPSKQDEKPVSDEIEALEKGGTVVLRGTVFEDRPDAITIQVGTSLFEIPKKYVLRMKEVETIEGMKTVEMAVAGDAKLIQRVLTSIQAVIAGRAFPVADGGGGSACDCACNCNCACNCACSQQLQATPAAAGGFRSRIA